MDLASLHVFQTVAREHSFSRAAEKLYRTQPAVSISMRKLEEWVGQPLFVRGSGARNLTDAGVLLLEYAERMLNLSEEIRKGIKELHGLERGEIAIGANESSIHALLPALDRYRRLHPGIHIRVHRVFSRDIPRELLNYQLDLGVISYIPEERELGTTEFLRDSLVLVAWPGHRLAKRREVEITELGEETFVAHIVESPYRQRVVQMFAKHHVPLRMDIELPTIESIKRFVEMKTRLGHRATDVRGARDCPRRFARIAPEANAHAAAPLPGVPARSSAFGGRARAGDHPSRETCDAALSGTNGTSPLVAVAARSCGFVSDCVSSLRGELVERGADAGQCLADVLRAPPTPIRKCSGASKKRPGTTLVSYFSINSWQKASACPVVSCGNTIVPASGQIVTRSRSRIEESLQKPAVRIEQLLRACRDLRQLIQGHHAQ